jgi:hypothetical protein
MLGAREGDRVSDLRSDVGRDRRVPFFLVAAIAAFALYYPTPEKYRWVPTWLGIVYVALAALTALDLWSKRHGRD